MMVLDKQTFRRKNNILTNKHVRIEARKTIKKHLSGVLFIMNVKLGFRKKSVRLKVSKFGGGYSEAN